MTNIHIIQFIRRIVLRGITELINLDMHYLLESELLP